MVKMNKATKQEIAEVILETYKVSREINASVGNELHQDYFENQFNLTMSELNEGIKALEEGNLSEVVDSIADQLVTGGELLMIEDGNDFLLKNAPKYLNESESPIEQLMYEAKRHLEQRNIVDYLGCVEDMAATVNADIVSSLKSVNASNLSKFPKVSECEDPDLECERIEDEGRYDNVYFEEITLFGEKHYVFKSTHDKKNYEHFPKGKYLKAYTFFEPSVVTYP